MTLFSYKNKQLFMHFGSSFTGQERFGVSRCMFLKTIPLSKLKTKKQNMN